MNKDSLAKEDRLLLAQAMDRYDRASSRYMTCRTDFLDMRQRTLIAKMWRDMAGTDPDVRLVFYGGYDDAERTVAFFIPQYADDMESKLSVIRAQAPSRGRKLTHRDYLGSLMGLGLKRQMIGDILVDENSADIVILDDIKDFLLLNYGKAGRTSLTLESLPVSELRIPESKTQAVKDTVASLRLDNIVSSAFSLSRSKAAEAVRSGLVFVNGMQEERIDVQIKEGDKLVLRGKGKAYLREIGGKTRKDRIYITIERYL